MNILCKLLGHKPHGPGWWGDVPYMKIYQGITDGLGRKHARACHECVRCGEEYLVGRLHSNAKIFRDACGIQPTKEKDSE